MASKAVVARAGLIATVLVIVGINTLSPLVKQPLPANGPGAMVVFSPPLAIPGGSAGTPATTGASDRTWELSSPPASSVGAADEPARAAPPPELPSVKLPAPAVITKQLPSDESSPATTQSSAEAGQAPPIAAATDPSKAEKRANRGHSRRVVRLRSAPFFYNEHLAAPWAYHRTPMVRPRSTPFSYNKQLESH